MPNGTPPGMGTVAASIFILTCIIIASVPCVIFARAILYNRDHQYPVGARAYVSEIYPHLKSGDILLFRGISALPHRYVMGTMFEHAAILLREGEIVYISEIERGSSLLMPDPDAPGAKIHMAMGVNATPLLTRVKYYNGIIYVMRLSRALDASRERSLKAAARRSCTYPTLLHGAAELALGLKTGTRHCFQHVAHMLDTAGLTPADAQLADVGFLEVCRELCNLQGRPLLDGYYYEPPVEIVYDIGVQRIGHDGVLSS